MTVKNDNQLFLTQLSSRVLPRNPSPPSADRDGMNAVLHCHFSF